MQMNQNNITVDPFYKVNIKGKGVVDAIMARPNDTMIMEDGTERKVTDVRIGTGTMYPVKQSSKHKKDLGDERESFGLVDAMVPKNTGMKVCTYQKLTIVHKPENENQLLDEVDDFKCYITRLVEVVVGLSPPRMMPRQRTIPHEGKTFKELMEEVKKELVPDRRLYWTMYPDDKIPLNIKQSTNLISGYIVKRESIIEPYLNERWGYLFEKGKPIAKSLVIDFAWLIGFWLGDGVTSKAIFALNKKEEYINTHLKKVTESWKFRYKQIESDGDNLPAIARICHLDENGNPTKYNSFMIMMGDLGFITNSSTYKSGLVKDCPKSMISEDPEIQYALYAGLIDSDGHSYMLYGIPYYSVTTIYPTIRNMLIGIAESLMLNCSVYDRPESFDEKYNVKVQKAYIVTISPGNNRKIFDYISNNCSSLRKKYVGLLGPVFDSDGNARYR